MIADFLLRRRFDLPKVEVPAYAVGVFGDWEVRVVDVPFVAGYFNGTQPTKHPNYVLRNNKTKTVWMSLTPMELESHAFHIELAQGHVVVGGLGMGMYLYNLCLKDSVTKITVIEKDPEVLAAFLQFSGCLSWAGWCKVEIVQADILSMPSEAVEKCHGCDYLYVDIWPLMGATESLDDMKTICSAVAPKKAGWWCQEFDYFEVGKIGHIQGGPAEVSDIWSVELGIPAVGHLIKDYDELIRAAMITSAFS